jgi:hypothetical protein
MQASRSPEATYGPGAPMSSVLGKPRPLNFLEFVVGQNWCPCYRGSIENARLFSGDWL